MITVNEVRQLRNNPVEFTKYAISIMQAWNGKNGEECNIVTNSFLNSWASYEKEENRTHLQELPSL